MNPIRNSAKAIIVRDGHLLAIRNRDSDGDWYILPGGGQNPGEPLTAALRRECHEEIGADVRVGELKLVREYIGRNHEFAEHDAAMHQVEFMFECHIDNSYSAQNGSTPDTYQTGVAWLPLSQLERFRLYPRILCTVLRKGVQNSPCAYLGDVN
ncbi:MAG: NUDIX domain-containing protein [Spirochaetaceae bacterium]|nr:NUDIX domain-containing protein [Spirochaetaceae bacterium]